MNEKEELILSTIWRDIGQTGELHSHVKKQQSSTKKIDQLTPGQKKIQMIKERNKLKIKNLHQKLKTTENLSIKEQWQAKNQNLRKKTQEEVNLQRKRIQAIRIEWALKKEKFLKELHHYKNAQFQFDQESRPIPKHLLQRPIEKITTPSNYQLIPGSLSVPIKDQKKRPTCAAFAGIRAIEVLLHSNGKKANLSEQYFYWSSKPNCSQRPCSKRGSWVVKGYNHSRSAENPDIPLESRCPYSPVSKQNNQTQTPLAFQCNSGSAKINDYQKAKTLKEAVSLLDSNQPIIIALKLSPNFYTSKGFISLKDSYSAGQTDQHASGHAVLLIGYMKLPTNMHSQEGKICFITANSWGEGWGIGGHSCLSENWIKKHRIPNPMISLNKVDFIL